MGVDITATSVPHTNIPSTKPLTSMPPQHLTSHHAHQCDYFDMQHFSEGPSMGLSPHGPSTTMPQSLSFSELDPLMSEHTSTHHGHILDPSWSPPPYRIEVGSLFTSLALLSTVCLSNSIPSALTLTVPDHLTVPSSFTPPQTNFDETMAASPPTSHITLSYHVDPFITHDFHIEGMGRARSMPLLEGHVGVEVMVTVEAEVAVRVKAEVEVEAEAEL
ncbi:hypothetical protein ACSBR1_018242 [Camellia fascicularis]